MKLHDFSTLTFDCYGTLIDWESGIWDALQPVLHANGRVDITRERALRAFAVAETARQAEVPAERYPDILRNVHAQLAQEFCLRTTATMNEAFGASVPLWPAFPDSADALRALKQRYRLVILSNVHRDGFAASNRKLGVTFDAIYTAEDIGSYKPNPANFAHLLERLPLDLGVSASEVLHTAQSLHHDHVQATAHDLATCWIDRQCLSRGGEWGATAVVEKRPETNFLYFTMAELAEAAG